MPFGFSIEDLHRAVLMSGGKSKHTLEGWRVYGKLTGFVCCFSFESLTEKEKKQQKGDIALLYMFLKMK